MPDRPLAVFTYAASASLAAVAVVYFFHPSYLFDGHSPTATASTRKKGIVGLSNPANDCFINCILQSLAGLGDLRIYLIRELHRRELGGPRVYGSVPLKDSNGKETKAQKLMSLQKGEVTQGLKEIVDKLNERPIYKKTISATSFIRVLERAFGTMISKAQQDAQELLQIVAERLSDEYHAGRDARKRFKGAGGEEGTDMEGNDVHDDYSDKSMRVKDALVPGITAHTPIAEKVEPMAESMGVTELAEEEDGFPLEGQTEARTECQFCRFTPKANPTSFVMLNLMVPHKSSSSLNDCFDAHFKTEYIEDYKCDKCRLVHAIDVLVKSLEKGKTGEEKEVIEDEIAKLQKAVNEDPEKVPERVALPDIKLAPKRKIARHVAITKFPKVLVIHLSRSIYDPRSTSTKNMAKVTFPERLPVGGILNRKIYKLLCVVTHRGTHNSGHYETFRRQHAYAPYSNPHANNATGPYSKGATPNSSMKPSPKIEPASKSPEFEAPVTSLPPAPSENHSQSSDSESQRTSDFHSLPSTLPSGSEDHAARSKFNVTTEPEKPTSSGGTSIAPTSLNGYLAPRPVAQPKSKPVSIADTARVKRKKMPADRWWRISDDKIKECKTSDVLDMKREVYMLFYEMEKNDEGG